MKIAFTAFLLFLTSAVYAQSDAPKPHAVMGIWQVTKEETGEPKAYVEIFEANGKCHGRIIKLFDEEPDAVCKKCPDEKKGKPLVGLVVIENLEWDDDEWEKGHLLNPANGKTYRCSMWLEDGRLKVRGKHWTGLYKTQTWDRVDDGSAHR